MNPLSMNPDYTNVTLDSLLETYLKFKLVYFYGILFDEKSTFVIDFKIHLQKKIRMLLYGISLKNVLSSGATTRILLAFFKKFLTISENRSTLFLNHNKAIQDSGYTITVAISSIYDLFSFNYANFKCT